MKAAIVSCCALLLLGCGGSDPRARYTPSEEAAQEALEAALVAWQNGKPPGPVEGTSPVVHMVDGHRKPGQKLQGFTVLGPAPGEGARVLAARLTLENPREEQKVRYVIVGIDPLWVFRYEDYEMMVHWDHPMGDDNSKKSVKR